MNYRIIKDFCKAEILRLKEKYEKLRDNEMIRITKYNVGDYFDIEKKLFHKKYKLKKDFLFHDGWSNDWIFYEESETPFETYYINSVGSRVNLRQLQGLYEKEVDEVYKYFANNVRDYVTNRYLLDTVVSKIIGRKKWIVRVVE